MSKEIRIAGVETFSMVDFPEQMSAVVFMQGCPWRCPFCHNAELQKIGQESGFEWAKFIKFLEERKGRLDAVVFSGGEPLVQDSLLDAIRDVKTIGGYKIGLHTGGFRPDMLKQVVSEIDWVGFDIKAPLEDDKYEEITQAKHLDKVKESLQILLNSGIHFECRTTCDPRYLSHEDIRKIGDFLAQKGVKEKKKKKYRPIESDKTTSDSACESFFEDKELLSRLRRQFAKFDIRK